MTAVLSVRDGSVYLPAVVVETYFRGIASVVVLIRDGTLMILPVHQATAGGCLLKLRNAAGDRVAQARDVFQDLGLLGLRVTDLPANWVSDQGALCAELPPSLQS
ncbi:hypothetical protein [Yoonia sp.]|uniref:hypothetical protein n=1 Tax=Yoonia sp. TaxID=2212373 RepID=UPI002FDA6166